MNLGNCSRRWALWALAAVLLLKSAMPFLASASAQMQGKSLVEVCTVYGVSLVPMPGDDGAPAPDHALGHGSEHCALSALPALATAGPAVFAPVPMVLRAALPPPARSAEPGSDACATWVARLKQGPPAFA